MLLWAALALSCSFKVTGLPEGGEDAGGGTGQEAGPLDSAVADPGAADSAVVDTPKIDSTLPDGEGSELPVEECDADADCKGLEDLGPCRKWECEPATGQCVKKNRPDKTSCDDLDKCTLGSYCLDGACSGKDGKPNCDDSNPCSKDWCEPAKGCQHDNVTGAPCNDGRECTIEDHCEKGKCTGIESCPAVSGECPLFGVCGPEGDCVYEPDPGCCIPSWEPWVAEPGMKAPCCEYGMMPVPFCESFIMPECPEPPCYFTCEGCETNMIICLPCGDGQCLEFENPCNCLQDCGQVEPGCKEGCPEGFICINGDCVPGGECLPFEICGDGTDNDCNMLADEEDPACQQTCSMPALPFLELTALCGQDSIAWDGEEIATQGLVVILGEPMCVPVPGCVGDCCKQCQAKVGLIAPDYGGDCPPVILKSTPEWPEVGCSFNECDPPEKGCQPQVGMAATVWGKFEYMPSIDPETPGSSAILVEGFCNEF
jgi:hypothetical protein